MKKIQSDPHLLADIRKYGKFNTNACFQCGSCTVMCELTNDSITMPRRSIRYSLLGLKKLLLSGLEPWFCYYCGDCSDSCPRETEPGEAIMTLRRYLTAQYDWTGLASRICTSKAWEIGALSFVGIFVFLLIIFYHFYFAGLTFPDFISEPMGMEHMFDLISSFTLFVFILPLFFLISNALRMFWFTIHKNSEVNVPFLFYFTEIKTFFLHLFTQKKYRECKGKLRWFKHLLLVSGTMLMFLMLIFFLGWFQTDNVYSLQHPQRWLGYYATGAIIYATVEILINRIRKREHVHKFSYPNDWILPFLLLLTAVSGIAVHIFRYLEFSLVTHYLYALHLAIAVPMLVVEIPFGKWPHMIYRPLAIYLQTVKEKALKKQLSNEAILDNVN